MPFELITLAAGIGSRFGGDKQIEGFGPSGESLLELNAFDAIRAGATSIVWITRDELVPALQELANRLPRGVARRIEVQPSMLLPNRPPTARDRPWGTAHAWLSARPSNRPTIVINADDLYGGPAMATVAQALAAGPSEPSPHRPRAWVGGYRVADTLSPHGGVSRALITVADDGPDDGSGGAPVSSLQELAGVHRGDAGMIWGTQDDGEVVLLQEEDPVSMNLWGFVGAWHTLLGSRLASFATESVDSPDVEFRIPDVVIDCVASGEAEAFVVPVRGRWAGVTFPEDQARLEAVLLEEFGSGTYPTPLFSPSQD